MDKEDLIKAAINGETVTIEARIIEEDGSKYDLKIVGVPEIIEE